MSVWRLRNAGTGVSLLYAGLVSTAAGLVVLGLLITFTSLIHVRSVLVTAADNGARVAAITGNTQVAQQAVADTLTEAGLPQSYGGQSLWSMSSTSVTSGAAVPEVQVAVHYNAPILFPDLFAALGHPNSLPLTIPITVTASDVNETYFTSS